MVSDSVRAFEFGGWGLRRKTEGLRGIAALGKPCRCGGLDWRLVLEELVKLITENYYKLAATPAFETAFPDGLTDEPGTDASVSGRLHDAQTTRR